MSQNDVRRKRHQFRRMPANFGSIGCGPVNVDPHISADAPAQLRQLLQECPDAGLHFWIVRSCGQEHADAAHALALLRTRGERQGHRAAKAGDERAAWHVHNSRAHSVVMAGHSRSKNGVASLAYVPPAGHSKLGDAYGHDASAGEGPAVHVFAVLRQGRRGCPRQARA